MQPETKAIVFFSKEEEKWIVYMEHLHKGRLYDAACMSAGREMDDEEERILKSRCVQSIIEQLGEDGTIH